jgi:tRNA A37 threonylcarbamoyladenosine synthetase subunit TsaC/SUA5/YrdC
VSHPLIVHVADAAQVPKFASHVPEFAHKLMAAFWPGPLTVILPRLQGVADTAAVLTQRLLCAAPRTRWHWLCCKKRRAWVCKA